MLVSVTPRTSASGLSSIARTGAAPNASGEPRPEAGAQRTLEGVGSTALFGAAQVRPAALPPRPPSSACLTRWEQLRRSRVGLPGDEDFAPGGNPARAEALRASGKQLVEAGLQQAAQALFESRAQ